MLTKDQITEILSDIEYKLWRIFLGEDTGGRMYLQIHFLSPCSITGEVKEQRSRKWWLSPHMTKTELVTTAFKAIMAAEEHEVREGFRYKGRQIYNPHFSVDDLVELSDSIKLDAREPTKQEAS